MHSNGGVYLPIEAVRQCIPPMPGPVNGAYATPTACMGDQSQGMTAFGMPASPCMQPVGSPVAGMSGPGMQAQWVCNGPAQWMCNGQVYQGVVNSDGSMTPMACGMPAQQGPQVIAVQ